MKLLPIDIVEYIINFLDIDTKRIICYYKKIKISSSLNINFRPIIHGIIDNSHIELGYICHVFYICLNKYKLSRSIKYKTNGIINIYYNMIEPSTDNIIYNNKTKYLKSTVKDNLTYNLLEIHID